MNAAQCRQLMPVLQAWADGKTIQVKLQGEWIDNKPGQHMEFCEPPEYYRVKPEPRHLFYAQDVRGEFVREFPSRNLAEWWLEERRAALMTTDFSIVEFIEVVS